MHYIRLALGWILKICNIFVNNYGLAIILFTIITKALLLPLTVKQQRSMAKTQRLQPLLTEIQNKYANDKEKQAMETQKLYKKYGVNPMSGCLPLLIQLPILFALYWVIKRPIVYLMGFGEDEVWRIVSAITQWAESVPGGIQEFLTFLNISDINILVDNEYKMFSMYEIQIAEFLNMHPEIMNSQVLVETGKNFDLINFNFLGLDLAQTPDLGAFGRLLIGQIKGLTLGTVLLWIIPILSGASSYLTSWLSQKMQPQQQPKKDANGEEQPNPMKSMMTIMPLMSAWFAFTLPAGVGLYWIVSNILQIVQQFVLQRIVKSDLTDEQIEGEIVNVKKNRKKRKK